MQPNLSIVPFIALHAKAIACTMTDTGACSLFEQLPTKKPTGFASKTDELLSTSSAAEQCLVGGHADLVVVLVVVVTLKLRRPDLLDLEVPTQVRQQGQGVFEEAGSAEEGSVVGLTEAEVEGSKELEEVGLTELEEVDSGVDQEGVSAIEVGMVAVAVVLDTNPMGSVAAHRRKEHHPGPEAAEEAVLAIEVGLAVAVLDRTVEGLRMGQRMAPATEDDRTMTDLRSTFQVATARAAVEAAAMLSR